MKTFCLILVLACLGQQALAKSLRTSEDNTVETTTYDWGKHTDPSRTTYDWGKHTQTTEHPGESTTYDWGKHTDPTRTTYDWGKHTGSTYDWGKHTSTSTVGPNDTTTTTTASPDDDHHNNHTDYRCSAGKYACAGTVGMCIDLKKICDAVVDCPHADDEQPSVCHFHQKPSGDGEAKYRNQFSGTGFMFQVRNIKVRASKLQMFDQDSLNTHEDSNEAK